MYRKPLRFVCLFLLLGYPLFRLSAQSLPGGDQGNGYFRNPILFVDYSDPDAIRVGKDYYMVSSSFNCMPGLPILHSKDLVNWKIINYALKRQYPENIYDQPQQGKGVWAPCIRFVKGEFYIYYPDPDYGIYMIKSKDPAKDWTKPLLVLKGKGMIDPAPFWDTDGKAYLGVGWAGSRAGVNSLITIFSMDPSGTHVIDEGQHVYDGHPANHTIEGPKIYKRNGYYYIFAPAGGVSTGWQLALRSKDIWGPYEAKTVLAQGQSAVNGPHQGAYIETPGGQPWFIHFQDKGPYGRIVHLEPVRWKNDWPIIGADPDGDGIGQPVTVFKKPDVGKKYLPEPIATNDEFNNGELGLQWQWQANPQLQWSAHIRGTNYLRLFAYPQNKGATNLWPAPNLLLQKLPAESFTITTKLTYVVEWDAWQGKKAGLMLMGDDYAYLAIAKDEQGFKVYQSVCKNALSGATEQVMAEERIPTGLVYLRIQVRSPNAGCVFSYSVDGLTYKPIGVEFEAKPMKWTGAKIGIFSSGSTDSRVCGYADFDWFRFSINSWRD